MKKLWSSFHIINLLLLSVFCSLANIQFSYADSLKDTMLEVIRVAGVQNVYCSNTPFNVEPCLQALERFLAAYQAQEVSLEDISNVQVTDNLDLGSASAITITISTDSTVDEIKEFLSSYQMLLEIRSEVKRVTGVQKLHCFNRSPRLEPCLQALERFLAAYQAQEVSLEDISYVQVTDNLDLGLVNAITITIGTDSTVDEIKEFLSSYQLLLK